MSVSIFRQFIEFLSSFFQFSFFLLYFVIYFSYRLFSSFIHYLFRRILFFFHFHFSLYFFSYFFFYIFFLHLSLLFDVYLIVFPEKGKVALIERKIIKITKLRPSKLTRKASFWLVFGECLIQISARTPKILNECLRANAAMPSTISSHILSVDCLQCDVMSSP
jgi:hypothetical protein